MTFFQPNISGLQNSTAYYLLNTGHCVISGFYTYDTLQTLDVKVPSGVFNYNTCCESLIEALSGLA